MKRNIILAVIAALSIASSARAELSDPILDRIKQNKSISIGYRESSAPFSFLDAQQKPVGYSTDICMKLVDALRAQLSIPDLAVRWVPINLQNRIPLVANGTVDISCESAVDTIGRQAQVDFSAPFFISHTRLLVKSGSPVKDVEDLDGKAVALPINSVPERLIKSLIDQKKLDVQVVSVKDNSEGFLAVSTGRADAFATDDVLLFGLKSKAANPADYEVVGRPLSFDPYGLIIQKNSTVFLSLVNATMTRMIKSGQMEELYKRWLSPLGLPLSDDLAVSFKLQSIPE